MRKPSAEHRARGHTYSVWEAKQMGIETTRANTFAAWVDAMW